MHKSNILKKLLTILIVSVSLIALSEKLSAQVTIGSRIPAKTGALLDLKESNEIGSNSVRGLLLPRVNLQKIKQLAPENGDYTDKESHTGLVVYNLVRNIEEDLCPGVYIWSGDQWIKVGNNGCLCEYTFVGADSATRYLYCKDFSDIAINAQNVCSTKAIDNKKYNYSLLKVEDYLNIWDKKSNDNPPSEFADGTILLDHKTWVTKGTKDADKTQVVGIGFSFPGGPAIGGYIDESSTIKCVRD